MGLPIWVNHIAFRASSLDDLQARLRRWLDHDLNASEIDHGWCRSIYVVDPNGILVEFCTSTRAMNAADREEAQRLLADPKPALEKPPRVIVHQPAKKAAATA